MFLYVSTYKDLTSKDFKFKWLILHCATPPLVLLRYDKNNQVCMHQTFKLIEQIH